MGACMESKVRVETYLPIDLVQEIDQRTDNRSEYLRELARKDVNGDAQ